MDEEEQKLQEEEEKLDLEEKKLNSEEESANALVRKELAKDKENKEVQQSEDMISKANTAALRQEDANEELNNLLDRQERMKVQETLGGKAEAGSKEQSKEEKEIESTKKFLKGTGYGEELFPEK